MDWPRAIDRNRDALKRIAAALFALAGLAAPGPSRRSLAEGGRGVVTLPRHLYAAILLILRPAESAVRRLIVILALCRNSGAVYLIPRTADAGFANRLQELSKLSPKFRTPAFALFDPLKSFDPDTIWNAPPPPIITSVPGFLEDSFNAAPFASPDEPVSAALLIARLRALRSALNDLPRQARRLARWQARRDALLKQIRPIRLSPMRPGLPPGWRERRSHEIDDVLRECHGLALDRLDGPDTG